MLKTVTWISLGLSILGALADLGGSDQSGVETAAELALLAKAMGAGDGPAPAGTAPVAAGQR